MLVRAQIGYQVIGGTKFYERAEIRDAVAYLTFMANPQDAGAFTRVANSPKRGLGQTSLSRVLSHADTMGVPCGTRRRSPSPFPASAGGAQGAGRFMSTMVRLRERMKTAAPVGDLLDELLRETGYYDALQAERTIEAQGRNENLEELVRVAREYDAMAEQGSVGEFLQQIALIADVDSLRDDEGLVTLMTLHNAKGLEFPIVFMIGMEDGVFPHSRALEEGVVEEERRLAYVGLTRAMRDLTLTYARRRSAFGGASVAEHAIALHRRGPARADRPGGPEGGRGRLGAGARRLVVQRRGRDRRGAARRCGRGLPARRRCRPCRVQRRRGDRDGARRHCRGALRRRRLGAQADGGLAPIRKR